MDYQSEYIRKNPTLHVEDAGLKLLELKSELSQFVNKKSLLDVGCGAGELTWRVAKFLNCSHAVGLDISKPALEVAKKRLPADMTDVVHFELADVLNYKPKHKFEVVLCADLLEHIKDDVYLLERLSSMGNVLVLRIPLEDSFAGRLLTRLRIRDEFKYTKEKYGHIHYYNFKSFGDLLRRSNSELMSYSLFLINKRRSWWVNEVFRWIAIGLHFISLRLAINFGGGFIIATVKRVS